MSEPSSSSPDITITVKGPSELKLSITISPSKSVRDLKEAIAAESDVEKERQRLIYSGKVLKDDETISSYKILTGHTIHMVKGAAKPADTPGPSANVSAQAPRLPQMGTGLNVVGNTADSVENMHHGLAGFNPFNGMGLGNLTDPNAMAGIMNNPEFLRQMSDLMSRPEVVDQIIASNPQLASMGPQVRQMMQSPMFRQMMSNPETLRMAMQMQSTMGGGAGGPGGFGGFPGMFGNPTGAGAAGDAATRAPTEPFPNLFAPPPAATATGEAGAGAGAGAPAANPFAALLGNPPAGGFNPWGLDPSLLFGAGQTPAPPPQDVRPPEELYATQLGQLNAMGLWDAQKNIRALRSTGGNVEAAIDLIFSGQLD